MFHSLQTYTQTVVLKPLNVARFATLPALSVTLFSIKGKGYRIDNAAKYVYNYVKR